MKSQEKQYSATVGGHSTMFYFAGGSDTECRRSIKSSLKSKKQDGIVIERVY